MQQQQTARGSLSRPAYLILTSLRYGPKHVVALREAIEQSEGLFFEPGTLYRFVASLEQRGWIEALTTEEPLRTYCITALGLLALEHAEASSQKEQQWLGGRRGWLRVRESIVCLVIWMLRLYPPAWRERYEAEMAALLRQHEITLWTLLDLLIGALSAHLDPHYRRGRQALPLWQLHISWRLLASAGVAFWFTSLFWLGVPGGPWILGIIGFLASVSFPCFLFAYVLWIVYQIGENVWNLLRLLPLAVCTMLFLHSLGSDDHVPLLTIVAFLVLIAESGGAMLTPEKRWIEENCNGRLIGDGLRFMELPALLVTIGMVLLCIATVPMYLDGQVKLVMVLTTIIALFALVYGFLALKAMRAATPKP
jgi:DNA-binding PadR family transcriptional regulator